MTSSLVINPLIYRLRVSLNLSLNNSPLTIFERVIERTWPLSNCSSNLAARFFSFIFLTSSMNFSSKSENSAWSSNRFTTPSLLTLCSIRDTIRWLISLLVTLPGFWSRIIKIRTDSIKLTSKRSSSWSKERQRVTACFSKEAFLINSLHSSAFSGAIIKLTAPFIICARSAGVPKWNLL